MKLRRPGLGILIWPPFFASKSIHSELIQLDDLKNLTVMFMMPDRHH